MSALASFPADVTVAIVAHNARAYLGDCLASIAAIGCPDGQVVVVDVASTDGLADWLATDWPGVEVVRLDRNDGPSPGRNAGIRHRPTKYVLLLDADVQLEPAAVALLHDAMARDPRIAIGSPVVVRADEPGLIQYADTSLHFICEAVNPYLDRPLAERGDDPRDIGVASTCALLLDRQVAIDVGLFDERYFIGKEDGDFTHRARLAGYRILELPGARVRHRAKARSDWLFYYQIRNRWHFLLKNYEVATLAVILPALVVHELLQLVFLVAKGYGLTYVKALGGLVAMLPDLPRDRALTRRIRRLHDRDVLIGGRMVVRSDLAGGGLMASLMELYEGFLDGYWRLVRRVLPRS
jgi:hypothetical protein